MFDNDSLRNALSWVLILMTSTSAIVHLFTITKTSKLIYAGPGFVLRWATVSGFSSRCRTSISVCNQPATRGQLSLPSLLGR